MKKLILSSLSLLIIFVCTANAESAIKVVSTLSTYASLAKTIGGASVETSYIAAPKFNPHFIEPKPTDVLKLKRADLFIHSGLDLEAWRDPLINAASRSDLRAGGKRQLDLSKGVRLLEIPTHVPSRAEGDIHLFGNPHYWLDPRNGVELARQIATKLEEIDPSNSTLYRKNLADFLLTLDAKMSAWQAQAKPNAGTEFIGYHNEWIYLMDFLGFKMNKFIEPKPGIPPSPQHIGELASYIRTNEIKGIVQATFYSLEAAHVLSERTGASVLLLCQNVGEMPEVKDYIGLIDYNISKLLGVVKR